MNGDGFLSRLFSSDLGLYSFQSANQIQEKNRVLAQKIRDENPSFDPDIIIGNFRGSLYGMRISLDEYFPKALRNRCFYVLDIFRYKGVGETKEVIVRLGLPEMVLNSQGQLERLKLHGKSILIVEDLSDYGVTDYAILHHIYSRLLKELIEDKIVVDSREISNLANVLQKVQSEITKAGPKIQRDLKQELQSAFEKYGNDGKVLKRSKVVTACAYIKPWTSFIPDYSVEVISAWIANSYEEQEIVNNILNNPKLSYKQKRGSLMRTGFSRKNLNTYLKNLSQRQLSRSESWMEYPLQKIVNDVRLHFRNRKARKLFDPNKLFQDTSEFN